MSLFHGFELQAERDRFAVFGVPATYSFAAGGSIGLIVAGSVTADQIPGGYESVAVEKDTDILVMLENVPNPNRGDRITITSSGQVYVVEQVLEEDGVAVKLAVTIL